MILCECIAVCLPTSQRPWQGSCLWLLNRRHILPAAFLLPRVTSWTAFTNLLCVPYAVFIAILPDFPTSIPLLIALLKLNPTSSILKQRFQFSLLAHRANELCTKRPDMTSHSLLLAYEMLFVCSLSASNCLCRRSKYLARLEHRGPYFLPFLWLRCFFTLQVHPYCLNFQITSFYPNSLGSIPGVANFLPPECLKFI